MERDDNTKSGENPTQDMAAPDHTVIIDAPRSLGCYRLTRLLGRGGMGEVWQAFDTQLERDVAIKLMRKELISNEDATRRFTREARAVARLNHSNIVQVYAFGDEKGLTYMVMEMVEGETVAQYLKRQKTLPLDESLHVLMQALEGLSYANARGIIHRDIKPSNLMLTEDKCVKIADFGLAKMVEHDTQMTAAGTAMGSPNYMSPEQARGEEADHRSDIYALGVSLYQMLCGELPFTAHSPVSVLLKQIQDPLPEPEALKKMSNGDVMAVLKKMTEKAPELRYQTYGDLASALATLGTREGKFKGAHQATASMPATKTPQGSPPPPNDMIVPAPVSEQTGPTQPDSLFSSPTADISTTPSDQKTAVVSSRDSTGIPADGRNGEKNRMFIPMLIGLGIFLLLIPLVWYLISNRTNELPDRSSQMATLNPGETTEPPATATPEATATDAVAAPAPSPSVKSPSTSGTPASSGKNNVMQPVDVTALITPRPTLMPGISATITPTPSFSELAPSSGRMILGGANDEIGAPVTLFDSAGNAIGSMPAGTPAMLIRSATLNGAEWYVIRHNGGEAFVSTDHIREAPRQTPTTGNQSPSRPIYVLGTEGAGPNEQVPAYLDNKGQISYKTFPAGTEIQKISSTLTMIRAIAPDGKMVYIYKKMASPK